jgi:RNA polymerase sigma factor (sigma-70 family)
VSLPPFQRLLDDHAIGLHRYLTAAVGPHDAADCFQETVLAALRAYPSVVEDSNLRGWLFTIAHNKVIDQARGGARRATPVEELPHNGAVDPEPDHELWERVRQLPPKQRSAVAHRYLLDLPYADIAEILGCSEDAARQNVRAGLAALRKELTA